MKRRNRMLSCRGVLGSVFTRTILGTACLSGVMVVGTLAKVEPHDSDSKMPAYPHGKFVEKCALCHSSNSWSQIDISREFDHGRYGFFLEGAHKETPCRACHVSLDFPEMVTACVTCHQDIHLGELGLDCAECHTANGFDERTKMQREHQFTRFPLTGVHATLDCDLCHTGSSQGDLVFVQTPLDCNSCHLADYDSSTDPDHFAGGFPVDCESCHGTATWAPAAFDHNTFGFQLTGGHGGIVCEDCHTEHGFGGLSTECVACHQGDYDQSTEPDHLAAGFDLDCTTCHSVQAWAPALFDHDASDFPLAGAHIEAACQDCHGNDVYDGLNGECAACHQDEYDTTTNPDHFAAGFPLDCAACHGAADWTPADFDHDGPYFPIYSGEHRNEWETCDECHLSPSNYADFTCLTCHPHDDRNKTNDEHKDVRDYSYDSLECFRCHPQGKE